MKRLVIICMVFIFGVLLAGCNLSNPDVEPTVEILLSDTPTSAVTPSMTPSATPSITPTQEVVEIPVQVASPLPTQAPDSIGPAIDVPPTESEEPFYRYIIKEGETLGYIMRLQPWGYPAFDPAIMQAIVALNDNMTSADFLPPPGSELLIPKRTPTPIPEGLEITQTAAASRGVSVDGGQEFGVNQQFGCHTVSEGESVVGLTDLYDTSLEVIAQLNQNLNWIGCDFTNYSGGPSCSPNITIGQCINVPLPTSTPIPTSTPSGNETATATPTYPPARTFYPPQGALAAGRIELQWVSVGILQNNEVYLIELADRTTSTGTNYITRNTSIMLPDAAIPADGQTHSMDWRVTIALENADGSYTPIGGTGSWRNFQWQSR